MRIALDLRFRTRSGGVSYINNIVPALLEAGSRHEFLLLRFEGQELPITGDWPTMSLRRGSAAEQALSDQILLPRRLKKAGVDIYHPLKLMGTLFPPCPQLTVAHAIAQPFRGEFPYTFSQRMYWQTLGTRIFRRSTAVIAVSNYVRDFLLDVVGVPEQRIHVIHHGINARFRRLVATELGEQNVGAPFLLTVGNVFPVKNTLVAVKVLAALANEHPQLRLKMAGATSHPYFKEVQAAVYQTRLTDRVDFLEFVPPDALVNLMNRATLMLMPSLTEGLPMVVLEALGCGLPTLASARGGIPEAGGDAVQLVDDPYDLPGWISATRNLLEKPDSLARLRAAALARAQQFSWGETARRTLEVYELMQ